MNGPDHYRRAEELIEEYREHRKTVGGWKVTPVDLSEAQVHATLALTAVKALEVLLSPGKPDGNVSDWAAPIGYVVDAEIVEDDS